MLLANWVLNRRQREADVAKTRAESDEIIARSKKTLSESHSVEMDAILNALDALHNLNGLLQKEANEAQQEAEAARREAQEARAEAAEANARSKRTEEKHRIALAHTKRLEGLLATAVNYIYELVGRMEAEGLKPPPIPQDVANWAAKREDEDDA